MGKQTLAQTTALHFHSRPSYYTIPEPILPGCETARRGMFQVFEHRDKQVKYLFTLSNRGERLANLTNRGIPLEDARTLFYQMDSK